MKSQEGNIRDALWCRSKYLKWFNFKLIWNIGLMTGCKWIVMWFSIKTQCFDDKAKENQIERGRRGGWEYINIFRAFYNRNNNLNLKISSVKVEKIELICMASKFLTIFNNLFNIFQPFINTKYSNLLC